MPKKESKIASQFRLTWQSAKALLTPEVLKEVDFSKGLGPAVDKIDKEWNKAADLDPVPDATKKALQKSVVEVQGIITKYHNQVVAGNKKLPKLGHLWYALEKALLHVDRAIVQDMDAIGIECADLKIWVSDSDFDRSGGHTGTTVQADPESEKKGFDTLATKLAGLKVPTKESELKDFVKLFGKFADASFPNIRRLSDTMGAFMAHLATNELPPLFKLLEQKKAAEAGAKVKKLQEEVEKFFKTQPQAGKLKTEFELHVVKPFVDRWKALGGS